MDICIDFGSGCNQTWLSIDPLPFKMQDLSRLSVANWECRVIPCKLMFFILKKESGDSGHRPLPNLVELKLSVNSHFQWRCVYN